MYAYTAMHRPIVTFTDTHRDEKETTRRAAFPQPGGRFRWWWRVLGSNQRRLSRRFYRPLPLTTRANRLVCVRQDSERRPVADSSFDVVSKVDRQEVDNAINQAAKEVGQRFDFKNTGA